MTRTLMGKIAECFWKSRQLLQDHLHLTARKQNGNARIRNNQQRVQQRDNCRASHLTVARLVCQIWVMMMMMIAFITFKSSLVPLFEGL